MIVQGWVLDAVLHRGSFATVSVFKSVEALYYKALSH